MCLKVVGRFRGELTIVIGHTGLSAIDIPPLRDCIDQVRETHDGRCALLFVVAEEEASTPGSEARDAAKDLITEMELNCIAVVVEGSGFPAAGKRAFGAGILLMLRGSTTSEIFADLGDALEWIAQRTELSRVDLAGVGGFLMEIKDRRPD
jgi:hypothetical protein